MDSNFTAREIPQEISEDKASSEEVFRIDTACSNLLGPVVVGGSPCADCFIAVDELQAGRKPEGPTLSESYTKRSSW